MDKAHTPIAIEDFSGLFRRGAPRNTPQGYATECINIKIMEDGIQPRGGIQPYQTVTFPLSNILRQYDYFLPTGSTYLTLVEGGVIYHITSPSVAPVVILFKPGMTDFGFVQNGTNAFLSPGYTDPQGRETGMPGEVIYVYRGDGVTARPAAGNPPSNGSLSQFYAANKQVVGIEGRITEGVHIIGVAFDGGTILGGDNLPIVLAPGNEHIQLLNIPIGPPGNTSRVIAMTKAIDPIVYTYNPDVALFTFFNVFTIPDNVTTSLIINFPDTELTVPFIAGPTPHPPSGAFRATQSGLPGHNDPGFRIISVIYETNTGAFTKPGPEFYAAVTTIDPSKAIDIFNIPVSPNAFVVRRHLLATKVIRLYNGDQNGFQFFFIPSGTINNNTTTEVSISWFDSELLEDASYLLYNLPTIPAGIVLSKYKNRMVSIAEAANISLARLSRIGDFESVSELDGFILFPPNNKPLSNAQEFRDVLYLFQDTKTIQYVDNEQEPATWKDTILDNGVGTGNHGIATVLDSGGVNVDYLLIGHYSGIFIFNGAYSRPELTFVINDLWVSQSRDNFFRVQIINDSVNQILYCVTTDGNLLVGDYSAGLTPTDIKWSRWVFDFSLRTIHLTNVDTLVLGAYSLPLAML